MTEEIAYERHWLSFRVTSVHHAIYLLQTMRKDRSELWFGNLYHAVALDIVNFLNRP